jgi:large subunit ribosomal protein L25
MTAATTDHSTMPSLAAAPRTAEGKGGARRLRRTGVVPAVAYGRDFPATALTVGPKEVLTILKSAHGQNTVIKMNVTGKDVLMMIKEFTYHPVTRALEHVDFVEVKLDREVDVDIPLVFTGKPLGVTAGGIIRQVYRTLPVHCLPDRIPLKIEVDIAHLNLSEHIATQDLKLGEGVQVRLPAEQTLIAIVAPEKDRTEDAVAPVAGAAAAAPAAGAAAKTAAAPAAKDAKAAPAAKDAKKK